MTWNPTEYRKFSAERLRPAAELLQRVAFDDATRIVVLGCSEGTVTRLLRERWPQADIVGVDSSPQMLDAARELDPLDDHGTLFARLTACLRPGGVLGVQMPRTFQAPSHTELENLVHECPWHSELVPLLRTAPVHDPAFYHDVLASRTELVDIWEIMYLQVRTPLPSGPVAPC